MGGGLINKIKTGPGFFPDNKSSLEDGFKLIAAAFSGETARWQFAPIVDVTNSNYLNEAEIALRLETPKQTVADAIKNATNAVNDLKNEVSGEKKTDTVAQTATTTTTTTTASTSQSTGSQVNTAESLLKSSETTAQNTANVVKNAVTVLNQVNSNLNQIEKSNDKTDQAKLNNELQKLLVAIVEVEDNSNATTATVKQETTTLKHDETKNTSSVGSELSEVDATIKKETAVESQLSKEIAAMTKQITRTMDLLMGPGA